MKRDRSQRTKVTQTPIINFKGMSPDRHWAVATILVSGAPPTAVVAIPVQGGAMRTICPAECMAKWSPDGARFYVEDFPKATGSGMTVVVPVPKEKGIPDLT